MLNYIWGGMIILSFFFALFQDLKDEVNHRWKNGEAMHIQLLQPLSAEQSQARIRFVVEGHKDTLVASSTFKKPVFELAIPLNQELPVHWKEVAEHTASENASGKKTLRVSYQGDGQSGAVILPEVRWIKMQAITDAAIDMAETAVSLAIGLVGVMAFWLGLMQIGYKSGMIDMLNKLVAPIMKRLFPNVPENHPAMSAMSLNMAANILGLGNAATPMGIKAMEELQKLNEQKDEASDAMCMFLAINTSSVQLLPPATLVALMGSSTNELLLPIIFATLCSTVVAILSGKWFSRSNRPSKMEASA